MFLHMLVVIILSALLILSYLFFTETLLLSVIGSVPSEMAAKMSMIKFNQRSWMTLKGTVPRVMPLMKTMSTREKLIVS